MCRENLFFYSPSSIDKETNGILPNEKPIGYFSLQDALQVKIETEDEVAPKNPRNCLKVTGSKIGVLKSHIIVPLSYTDFGKKEWKDAQYVFYHEDPIEIEVKVNAKVKLFFLFNMIFSLWNSCFVHWLFFCLVNAKVKPFFSSIRFFTSKSFGQLVIFFVWSTQKSNYFFYSI